MAIECPSCHRDTDEIWSCVECGRMFCVWCGGAPLSLLFRARCPDCSGVFSGRGETVSKWNYGECADEPREPTDADNSSYDDYGSYAGTSPVEAKIAVAIIWIATVVIWYVAASVIGNVIIWGFVTHHDPISALFAAAFTNTSSVDPAVNAHAHLILHTIVYTVATLLVARGIWCVAKIKG